MSIEEPELHGWSDGHSFPEPMFDAVRRGYNPRQVQQYVAAVTDRMQILENRVVEFESQLEEARLKVKASGPASKPADPYEAVSDRVTEALRAFDQDVERIRGEADAEARRIVDEAKAEAGRQARDVEKLRKTAITEADRMLAEARAEADRIRVDAQAKAEDVRARAERALEDARARADALLSDLDSRRESLLAEITTLYNRMIESARELEPVLVAERAPDEVVVAEDDLAAAEETGKSAKLVSPGG